MKTKVDPYVSVPKPGVPIFFTVNRLGEKYGYVVYSHVQKKGCFFNWKERVVHFVDAQRDTKYQHCLITDWRYITPEDQQENYFTFQL